MISLDVVNDLSVNRQIFFRCCASDAWVDGMIASCPFQNEQDLLLKSREVWFSLSEEDHLEAFKGHAMIGDIESLKEKYKTKEWSLDEQSGANAASDHTLEELKDLNQKYYQKFGFIFIVCATGKSADEMLDLLGKRVGNERSEEIRNAAIEQDKITRLRLEKL